MSELSPESVEVSETVETTYEPTESADGATPAPEYGDESVTVTEESKVEFSKDS